MIRTVYSGVKLNMHFMHHPRLVELIKLKSAHMGIHHQEKNAAKRMMILISKYMHMDLLSHLCDEEYGPLSSIIVSTTDRRGANYLIILWR